MQLLPQLDDLLAQPIAGQRVLVRTDLNLPYADNGHIADTTRLNSVIPCLLALQHAGARIGVLSHLGRPHGVANQALSLGDIAKVLGEALDCRVPLAPDCIGTAAQETMDKLGDGDICLLENTRFHAGETKNDPDFVQALSTFGSYFVLDAFSIAHRKHASCYGLMQHLPSYAGPALNHELAQLHTYLHHPKQPLVAVMGGAKISDKITTLRKLAQRCQAIMLGGAMANTFLLAQNIAIGQSRAEPHCVADAQAIMALAKRHKCSLVLPSHVVAAPSLSATDKCDIFPCDAVPKDYTILDCAVESLERCKPHLDGAATLIWNGPLGVYETPPYDAGSLWLVDYISARAKTNQLIAIAGGGESAAVIKQAQAAKAFAHISTAGGAFLDWLATGSLPCIEVLRRNPSVRKNPCT